VRPARHWKVASALAVVPIAATILGLAWMTNARQQTIYYEPISDALVNPLMGWAPWASLQDIQQPHTLVYADLTWRDFEPQPGVFDFEGFEKQNQFARWRGENQRVVFRLVCDVPGPQAHRDIPDWLYEATTGNGQAYDNQYGKGFSPDYSNPEFIRYHRKALQALGKRYGGDDFLAYIELGSLGHWGEWHVDFNSGIRQLPSKTIRDQYVQQYREAFPNTALLMRRPFSIARQLNLGLYNDLTGEPRGTNEWLGWIANGGQYDQTGEMGGLVPMADAWQTAPIGGEQAGNVTPNQMYGQNLPQTIELLERSHTSFIGPDSPANLEAGGPLQPGIDSALARLGYRLYIQQVKMPVRVAVQNRLDVQVSFANSGIAPIYYNWPTRLYLIDRTGEVRSSYLVSIDLRKILPGAPYSVQFSMPLQDIENGQYDVGLAILDPSTQQPAIRFAMPNPRADLIQILGQVEIIWRR
jgi:hypothetical protein